LKNEEPEVLQRALQLTETKLHAVWGLLYRLPEIKDSRMKAVSVPNAGQTYEAYSDTQQTQQGK